MKQRINELKTGYSGQKKRDLGYQHSTEMKNLEDNFNNELLSLNEQYEEKFNEFSSNAKAAEDNMSNKHRKEMEELVEQLDQRLPKTIKYSREYLDLKQSEANCVKQER